MATDSALDAILHSHLLPQYAREINEKLALETAARERFYDEISESQKAEFIDGKVVVHSPAKVRHIEATARLLRLLGQCVDRVGGLVLAEKALCVFTRNDYEPDIVYYDLAKAAAITPDMMKLPVPDFLVEVLSESTEKIDRGVKFKDYAAHGVQEYWIIDSREQSLEQYLLSEEGAYSLKLKSTSGDVTSQVVRDFTIPIRAIFDPAPHRETMKKLLS